MYDDIYLLRARRAEIEAARDRELSEIDHQTILALAAHLRAGARRIDLQKALGVTTPTLINAARMANATQTPPVQAQVPATFTPTANATPQSVDVSFPTIPDEIKTYVPIIARFTYPSGEVMNLALDATRTPPRWRFAHLVDAVADAYPKDPATHPRPDGLPTRHMEMLNRAGARTESDVDHLILV